MIDAKYKAEKPSGYPNADLYQLLAYCTVLGLRVGTSSMRAGNESSARHVVRRAGTEIICHALDLGQPTGALIGEIRKVARAIAGGQSLPSA